MTETRTIRVSLESEHHDIETADLFFFPLHPPPDVASRLESGEPLQINSARVVDNVAQDVPVYGPGEHFVILLNAVLREKHRGRELSLPELELPLFTLAQEDLYRGECHVPVPSAGKLRVTVLDNQDQPIAGAEVSLGHEGSTRSSRTDETGNVRFTLTIGKCFVLVSEGENREVVIRDALKETTVVLRRPGRSCIVTALDSHGQPVPEVRVKATVSTRSGRLAVSYRMTGEEGQAVFAGLEAGTYTFELADRPSRPAFVTIKGFAQHAVTLVSD